MAKVILRCEKIKQKNMFTKMHKHNFRTDYCENIDKTNSYKNEELVVLPEEDTYKTAFEKRIRESEYYKTHKIRSNAVLGIDVQIGFSREKLEDVTFDLDTWKKQAVKWVEDTFGKENVISAVLHMDESSPHIHAVIIPMDEGRLNCSKFLGTPEKMRNLQSSIGQYMSEVGLERGGRRSVAKHIDIQEYYGALETATKESLPLPKEDEEIDDYYNRANEIYRQSALKMFAQENKAKAEIASLMGNEQAIKDLEKENLLLAEQNQQLKEMLEKAKKSIGNAQKNQKFMNSIIYAINNGIPSKEEAAQLYKEMVKVAREGEIALAEKNKGELK